MKYVARVETGIWCWFDTDSGIGGFAESPDKLENAVVLDIVLSAKNCEREIINLAWNEELKKGEL